MDVLDKEITTLWWAGKEMIPGKKLADYVGKNEKTKIVAKLQKVSVDSFLKDLSFVLIMCSWAIELLL